jgi:hypothetical protein
MRHLLWERKTSGEDITPGSPYWMRLVLDPQISLYYDLAESLGITIDGVIYDVLYKPKLKPLLATPVIERKYTQPTKKEPTSRLYANQRDKDETPSEYGERVCTSIAEAPDKHYQRRTIVRLQGEREEARADVWQTGQNIREARHLALWPRNPDSCFQYFRECDYYKACSGLGSIDDPLFYHRAERSHEELESDSAKDEQALVLLTQSSLRTFRACPRRYLYRYEQKVRAIAPQDEKLRRGSSLHRALETWSKSGGDLDKAIAELDRTHPQTQEPMPFSFELEKAMMIGYHARWEHPGDVMYVEKECRLPLINPKTGKLSRSFELGGKLDKIALQSD